MIVLAVLVLAGCSPPIEPILSVQVGEGTLSVQANVPLSSVRLIDHDGTPQARTQPAAPASTLTLVVPASTSGVLTVEAAYEGGVLTRPVTIEATNGRLWVEVQAPIGTPAQTVRAGDVVTVSVVDGLPVPVVVRAKLPVAGPVEFAWDGETAMQGEGALGQRVAGTLMVGRDGEISVRTGTENLVFFVNAIATPLHQFTEHLVVREVRFPASPNGSIDLVRPRGRVTIPSDWWRTILSRLGLGTRIHDPFEPWAFAGVEIENTGETAADLIVRTRVMDPVGSPDPSFRPRMREGDDGTGNTSVMVRVPAHRSVTATLPVYVDEDRVGAGPWAQQVALFPIGSALPAVTFAQPLYLSRGSSVLSAGLGLALCGSVSGMALIALRLRRWLADFDTRTLVTIALFASLSFVVGTAAQLVGLGVASAAGPFATMIVGLLDDAFAVTLASTLLAFAPRPGVVALCTLVTWLLRGIALGSLSPLDIVFVACRIAFYEGALWTFGLTRSGTWRDEPHAKRRMRLAAGFGVASLLTSAASMVFHAVLYRLFFAEWYVVMILAGPGFTYTVIGTLVGDRIATALRRVED